MPKSLIFDASNALGARVVDVDTKRELTMVLSVDIDKGEVIRACVPLRVDGDAVATYTERFRSIHPIFGDSPWPQLFHCYGQQIKAEAAEHP